MAGGGKPAVEIWVPGPWADRGAIESAIGASGRQFTFDLDGPEPDLARWMDIGSGRAFDDDQIAAIAAHRSIVKLAVEDRGADLADVLLTSTRAIKAAGGLGVRLEKCGLAHPFARWEQFLSEPGGAGLYRALVLQVPDDERAWLSSFGMNQFGLPDAAYDGDDFEGVQAATTVFAFNGYLREERPKLADGHTFAYDQGAPVVRLAHEVDDRYAVSDPYFNPQGIWVLSPVE